MTLSPEQIATSLGIGAGLSGAAAVGVYTASRAYDWLKSPDDIKNAISGLQELEVNMQAFAAEYKRLLLNLYERLLDGNASITASKRGKNAQDADFLHLTKKMRGYRESWASPILPMKRADDAERGKIYLRPAHQIYLFDGSSLLQDNDTVEFVSLRGTEKDQYIPLGRRTKTVVIETPKNWQRAANLREDILVTMDITDLQEIYSANDTKPKEPIKIGTIFDARYILRKVGPTGKPAPIEAQSAPQ